MKVFTIMENMYAHKLNKIIKRVKRSGTPVQHTPLNQFSNKKSIHLVYFFDSTNNDENMF